MFTSHGPSVRELAVQALSSVERGYDLLAPKFDHTPFRTPDRMLDAVEETLAQREGSFRAGLDVCCGTGAGIGMLRRLCRERVTGVDLSAGMLAEARRAHPDERVDFVRADARALPSALGDSYDLAVSFGAFGHFLPAERPALFSGIHAALREGGVFAFPIGAPIPPSHPLWWAVAGFDAAMRVRNAVWRPPFVMYYRTFPLGGVRADLRAAGFAVDTVPLEHFGRQAASGAPRWRLVLARKTAAPAEPAAPLSGPAVRA
ncbi:class I SAM-dependent methyltransferase [Streptomyces sp. NBC_00162]|uniref:class I SAM-dependent methyltransferase n=1 Tax=Streptomyces sp. NBC_00162 TaxID=2903629 RepID=UPI00214B7949|nr:class I SAM-dependent methyltransferase [Streptomyces sp. NBC_00162]UUU40644.1 class I SAM-dependent methyltransferase [Streptomyces sp. NBC_00162]